MRSAKSNEVATALGVKPTTIQRYAREGRIPFDVTFGGHRRFDVDEVRAALANAATFHFVDSLELDPLAGGPEVIYSSSASREAQLRTMRAEPTAPSEAGPGEQPAEPRELITTAKRILISTPR